MAYGYRSAKYWLPSVVEGDYISASEEAKKVDIIDGNLEASLYLQTPSATKGRCVIDEGIYTSAFSPGNSSVTLIENKPHPSFEGLIDGIYVRTTDGLAWTGLENNQTYYLYVSLVETDTDSSRRYGDVTTVKNTTGVRPAGCILVATATTTDSGITVNTNPDGKSYFVYPQDHIRDSSDPHGTTLEQTNLDVENLVVDRAYIISQLDVSGVSTFGDTEEDWSRFKGTIYGESELDIQKSAYFHSGVTIDKHLQVYQGIDVGSTRITGLATPTQDSDAATKAYVDNVGAAASGVDVEYTGSNVVSKATTLNFSGVDFIIQDEGSGKVLIGLPDITSGVDIEYTHELVSSKATILDFSGLGVGVSDLGNGRTLIDIPGGTVGGVSGATTFLQLDDTPSSYIGKSGMEVRVTADETGLEFLPVSESEDEKVKADSEDVTPGYLDTKVDDTTLEVDTTLHQLRVKDDGIGVNKLAHNIDATVIGFNADKVDGKHASEFASVTHATTHQDGGSDEINVEGLSGLLADAQKVNVRDDGGLVGTRKNLHFSGLGVSVSDDAGNDEILIDIPGVAGESDGGVTTFLQLEDTPSSYVGKSGMEVRVTADETGLEFVEVAGGDSISNFLQLDDTPSSYIDRSGMGVRVTADETGLEFVELSKTVFDIRLAPRSGSALPVNLQLQIKEANKSGWSELIKDLDTGISTDGWYYYDGVDRVALTGAISSHYAESRITYELQSGLDIETLYKCRVRAYYDIDGTTYYGEWFYAEFYPGSTVTLEEPPGLPAKPILVPTFTYDQELQSGVNVCPVLIVPASGTIEKVYAYVKQAPVGASIVIDINKNDTSLWYNNQDNRLTIPVGEKYADQTEFDIVEVDEGDILSMDIDQVGSTTPGSSLTVELRMRLG